MRHHRGSDEVCCNLTTQPIEELRVLVVDLALRPKVAIRCEPVPPVEKSSKRTQGF